MKNYVLLMANACSSGVWDSEGGPLNLADLPVSKELKQTIKAWNKVFDNYDEFGAENPLPKEFSTTGLSLARLIKDELPNWVVKYYDESLAEKYGDRYLGELDNGQKAKADYTRTLFEYEILS